MYRMIAITGIIIHVCDVVCGEVTYCGTNIVGHDQTPRGVWSGPLIFVARGHLQKTFVSFPAQC